jgi:hypothetical protein
VLDPHIAQAVFLLASGKKMEDSNEDVVEIDPPVLTWTRRKKYWWQRLIEPLDPYFYRCSKHNKGSHQTIDVEDVTNPIIIDSVTDSDTEDVAIR